MTPMVVLVAVLRDLRLVVRNRVVIRDSRSPG